MGGGEEDTYVDTGVGVGGDGVWGGGVGGVPPHIHPGSCHTPHRAPHSPTPKPPISPEPLPPTPPRPCTPRPWRSSA